ncbi:MAG: hypothetical protein WBP61_11910 [Nocardioides sp.]
MDDAAWAALTLSLSVLGGIWTWFSFRRRGLVSGMRALGFTMLPLAAYLTQTLQMFTEIGNAVADWAAHLVFSPVVWLGVVIGGVGITLVVASGMLRTRQLARASTDGASPALSPPAKRGAPAIDTDPEMAEIEALLRKRGIS